jgi:CheY-like chemotaxis protein
MGARRASAVPVLRAIDGTVAAVISRVHRILVAEDDPEMRRLVVESFRRDGHEVLEVEDGRQMFDVIAAAIGRSSASACIDLIVSDVRMPPCGGLDVVELFAMDLWLPPLLLITGFPDQETRDRAKRLGAILIDKPLSLWALRTAAMDLLVKPRWLRSLE